MLNKGTAQDRSYLFVSAKTAFSAIPARHVARRDALIEASLDQEVRSISYVASACLASERMELDAAVVVERANDCWLLDVVPARRLRSVEEERLAQIALSELGLKSIVLTTEEIRREPRSANARMVLSYRDTPVSVGLRMRILQTLLERADAARGTPQKHP